MAAFVSIDLNVLATWSLKMYKLIPEMNELLVIMIICGAKYCAK